MRARAVVFIFAAWPCFIHTQTLHSPREINSNSIENKNESSFPFLVSCVEKLGLTKCASAYSVWKAERVLELSNASDKVNQDSFHWQQYVNRTDEELYSQLCDGTERLLQRRPLTMNLGDYSLELGTTQDGILRLDLLKEKGTATGRSTMKKMQKMMKNIMPLLVVPGLIMSAILPFFLPSLKMMAMAAGVINQMALMGAIFTLFRNHALGNSNSHGTRIVYLNKGYLNEKYEPYADTHSEVFADPSFDSKFNSHELKDYNFFDNNGPSNFQNDADFFSSAGHMNVHNVINDINEFNWGKDYSSGFKESGLSKKIDEEIKH